MGINTYIKDFTRYPVGFTRTVTLPSVGGPGQPAATGGGAVIYNNTTDCVSINSAGDNIATTDGTGINQLRAFRTKFDVSPFTDVTSTTTATTASTFISTYTANNTQPVGKPYLFSQFKGAEAAYISFVRGTRNRTPSRSKTGSGLRYWFRCKFFATKWMFDKGKCFRWTYYETAKFTMRVRGGYGSTGKFGATLSKLDGTGTHASYFINENDTFTFSTLRPSYEDGPRSGSSPGPYKLVVEDLITGNKIQAVVTVPGDRASQFIIQQRGIAVPGTAPVTQQHTDVPDGSTAEVAESRTNALWLPFTVTNGPPYIDPLSDGVADVSYTDTDGETVDMSPCTTSTVTLKANINDNPLAVRYNIQWRYDNETTWTNIAAEKTIAANSGDTVVQETFTVTNSRPTLYWRVIATNAIGQTIADMTGEEFASVDLNLNKISIGPGTPTYNLATNSIELPVDTQSCKAHTLTAFYWNTATSPNIVADLGAMTSFTSTLDNLPANSNTVISAQLDGSTTQLLASRSTTFSLPAVNCNINYVVLVLGQNIAPYNTFVTPEPPLILTDDTTSPPTFIENVWTVIQGASVVPCAARTVVVQGDIDDNATISIRANGVNVPATLFANNTTGGATANIIVTGSGTTPNGNVITRTSAAVNQTAIPAAGMALPFSLPQTAFTAAATTTGRRTNRTVTDPSAANNWTATYAVYDGSNGAGTYTATYTY